MVRAVAPATSWSRGLIITIKDRAGVGTSVGPGVAVTTIDPDAIQEYRVIEHIPPAEYGKGGGFVTDTVLKSGTNHWHGSLFEYNRVQALAANSWFSNP